MQMSNITKSVVLRPVEARDEGFLLEVYASTRAEELATVPWDQTQKEAFIKMQFDLQRAAYAAYFPTADHSIIMVDDSPIGRIMVNRQADDEIRGVDIAILPAYRKLGVGTYLINDLLHEAAAVQKPFRIQVDKFNTAAMRLYERLGFEKTGESLTHIAYEFAVDNASGA